MKYAKIFLLAFLVLCFSPVCGFAQVSLDNPAPGSYQSGIGIISGWICQATRVDIDVDGMVMLQAAYGTGRSDTQGACGDTNNGFGLLVNWNLLSEGSHQVRVLADGREVATSTFMVATLGLGQYPLGLSGAFLLPNFPQMGKTTRIQWQEKNQNFVITSPNGSSSDEGRNSPGARLENPVPGSFQSGIGIISGWICQATRVDIDVDGVVMLQAAYGTGRSDTQSDCGDTNNGFGLLVNWNLLSDGSHRVRVLADGREVATSTFMVATLGLGQYPQGLSGSFLLSDFPQMGETTRVQWQEKSQNFVITRVEQGPGNPNPKLAVSPSASLDFGQVAVGSFADMRLTVTNSGGGILTGRVTATTPFSVVAGAEFSLSAGASSEVIVRFSPINSGLVTGNINVTSTGGNAILSVTSFGSSLTPQITINPPFISFGTTATNAPFTVFNSGTGTLQVTSVTLASGSDSQFHVIGPISFDLAPGSFQVVTVRGGEARPSCVTEVCVRRSGTIIIDSNAGPATVELVGP